MGRCNRFITFAAAIAAAVVLTAALVSEARAQAARGAAAPKVVVTAEFDGVRIPVSVFYTATPNSEWSEYTIDSLQFTYGGRLQSVPIGEKSDFFSPTGENSNIFSLDDYNFDGHPDVEMLTVQGTSNRVCVYFIYDPRTQKYSYSNELSGMMNLEIDKETQTIYEGGTGGHAGLIRGSSSYKWLNGKLTPTYTMQQDYDERSGMYLRITKTLQNDNSWTQETDTVTASGNEFSGRSEKFIPAGYTLVTKVQGDLNKDGRPDDVLVIQKNNAGYYIKGIIIALKEGNGYELVLENIECFDKDEQGNVSTVDVSIRNGNLFIKHETHHRNPNTYNFRYQNSEFVLIGYDSEYHSNGSNGWYVYSTTSINFLSKRMQTKTRSGENERFAEKWENFTIDTPITLPTISNFGTFGVHEQISITGAAR